eukprot:Anaeramoba_ignava/a350609_192.p1 GENE.a350609_192~~a350609_192.p1  ORF type:complete len:388 (-),score=118.85 a350609_192:98-1228(-)
MTYLSFLVDFFSMNINESVFGCEVKTENRTEKEHIVLFTLFDRGTSIEYTLRKVFPNELEVGSWIVSPMKKNEFKVKGYTEKEIILSIQGFSEDLVFKSQKILEIQNFKENISNQEITNQNLPNQAIQIPNLDELLFRIKNLEEKVQETTELVKNLKEFQVFNLEEKLEADLGDFISDAFTKWTLVRIQLAEKGEYEWNTPVIVPPHHRLEIIGAGYDAAKKEGFTPKILMTKCVEFKHPSDTYREPLRCGVSDFASLLIKGVTMIENHGNTKKLTQRSDKNSLFNICGNFGIIQLTFNNIIMTEKYLVNSGVFYYGRVLFGHTWISNSVTGGVTYAVSNDRGWNFQASGLVVSRSHTYIDSNKVKWGTNSSILYL